ncbi:carboxypeptidase Q-like [Plodia interpunctella]|uniref:carboxypeptidase Q-like n=1 Tax=Plodia interpunctella TaxID=58824 RepID=UPI0023687174|nr:carboxypeptidase Q-like [Plodia interpunctella]
MRMHCLLLFIVYEVQCLSKNKSNSKYDEILLHNKAVIKPTYDPNSEDDYYDETEAHSQNTDACSVLLPAKLVKEIGAYQDIANEILQYVIQGDFKGQTYNELTKFVDKFGARPAGTEILEESIDYIIQLTRQNGINTIVTEEVEITQWQRGAEKITMKEPRPKNIAVLGLGGSVSTPNSGITAEVIVVKSFKELDSLQDYKVKGKIVLFNAIYKTYFETVEYREEGATRAAKKGAVASLVRSITPVSIYTPHTGMQTYGENVTKIPTAAITIEDAELINRLYERGEKVVLNIKLHSNEHNKISRNTIVDHKGVKNPEKFVIVSGHIDSWDVGQGAMDDGGGLFISWAVPVILKRLNLRPRRTIRSIFWTAEEIGLIGAQAYEKKHRNESKNINFIMESDEGTFAPLGLEVAGNQEARCIIAEVLKLFKSINASTLKEAKSPGSDITVIIDTGVPGAGLLNANDKYFWFHHTEADTILVEDEHELDLGAAFWTAVAYIIADISVDIPR